MVRDSWVETGKQGERERTDMQDNGPGQNRTCVLAFRPKWYVLYLVRPQTLGWK